MIYPDIKKIKIVKYNEEEIPVCGNFNICNYENRYISYIYNDNELVMEDGSITSDFTNYRYKHGVIHNKLIEDFLFLIKENSDLRKIPSRVPLWATDIWNDQIKCQMSHLGLIMLAQTNQININLKEMPLGRFLLTGHYLVECRWSFDREVYDIYGNLIELVKSSDRVLDTKI